MIVNVNLDLIDDVVLYVASLLPNLPKVFRYYDDFNDEIKTIKNIYDAKSIKLSGRGRFGKIDFTHYDKNQSIIIKNLTVFLLSEDLSPITVSSYINAARCLTLNELREMLSCGPHGIIEAWLKLRSKEYTRHLYLFVRSILRMLSAYRIGGWSEEYVHLLHNTLQLPATDKYAGVRTQDAFISVYDESIIVSYLDDIADSLKKFPGKICINSLIDSAMLLCSYQFGMRPLQIAFVRMMDVRRWHESDGVSSSIHLTFLMIKQKSGIKSKPLTRKVKSEWSNIVGELYSRRMENGATGNDKLFAVKTASEAGSKISNLLKKLIPRGVSATDLRHTAAMRLVDSGASKEELAEFLGHSDVNTCLVYFTASATQNELVNKALGISEIYSTVARISRDKYISADELSQLKDEQQIAGVPHGIPIAGIGGCSSGQPLCHSNPILACYGCHKFMPIHDISIHEQVLDDFRKILNTFRGVSRDEKSSPPFLQLQHTISCVQAIIEEIRGLSA